MWGSRANCLNILEVCVMCTWQKESGNSSLTAAAAEPQTTQLTAVKLTNSDRQLTHS